MPYLPSYPFSKLKLVFQKFPSNHMTAWLLSLWLAIIPEIAPTVYKTPITCPSLPFTTYIPHNSATQILNTSSCIYFCQLFPLHELQNFLGLGLC